MPCTPGQTVGPFFGLGLTYERDSQLVGEDFAGAIRVHGTVYDGAGTGVPDALVELWQPDSTGKIPRATGALRRDGPTFTGWGRVATDAGGRYEFTTLAPGSVSPGRAPFFAITVFARGLLHRLCTRAYLPGGVSSSAPDDPLLSTVDPTRRGTLLCAAETDGGATRYRFDIHLQGPHETVFLAYEDERR